MKHPNSIHPYWEPLFFFFFKHPYWELVGSFGDAFIVHHKEKVLTLSAINKNG